MNETTEDILVKLEDYQYIIEQAFDYMDTAFQIKKVLLTKKNTISMEAIQVANNTLQNLYVNTGVRTSFNTMAMENYSIEQNVNYTLEGLGSFLKDIWEGICNAFKNFWNWITSYFTSSYQSNLREVKEMEVIVQELPAIIAVVKKMDLPVVEPSTKSTPAASPVKHNTPSPVVSAVQRTTYSSSPKLMSDSSPATTNTVQHSVHSPAAIKEKDKTHTTNQTLLNYFSWVEGNVDMQVVSENMGKLCKLMNFFDGLVKLVLKDTETTPKLFYNLGVEIKHQISMSDADIDRPTVDTMDYKDFELVKKHWVSINEGYISAIKRIPAPTSKELDVIKTVRRLDSIFKSDDKAISEFAHNGHILFLAEEDTRELNPQASSSAIKYEIHCKPSVPGNLKDKLNFININEMEKFGKACMEYGRDVEKFSRVTSKDMHDISSRNDKLDVVMKDFIKLLDDDKHHDIARGIAKLVRTYSNGIIATVKPIVDSIHMYNVSATAYYQLLKINNNHYKTISKEQ